MANKGKDLQSVTAVCEIFLFGFYTVINIPTLLKFLCVYCFCLSLSLGRDLDFS